MHIQQKPADCKNVLGMFCTCQRKSISQYTDVKCLEWVVIICCHCAVDIAEFISAETIRWASLANRPGLR